METRVTNEMVNAIVNEIKRNAADNTEVKCVEVIKNNDVKLHGITILYPNEEINPTVYIENLINENNKHLSISDLAFEIAENIEKAREMKNHLGFNPDDISDFDKIKDMICVRLINAESNKELLKSLPYEKVYDLAKILVIEINENMSIKVNHKMFDFWKENNLSLSISDVFDYALENTKRKFPANIKRMDEVMAELIGMEINEFLNVFNPSPLYVLTNNVKTNGAICLLYDNILKEFAEKIRSDFVILPSSVHELILHPVIPNVTKENLKDIITEINETEVDDIDVLSNHPYIYRKETGKIEY